MSKKNYMIALATALVVPPIVAPVAMEAQAQSVTFKDVPKTSNYYEAVMDIVKDGVIFGYEDKSFRPGTKISRVQVAMLLSRALPLEPIRGIKEFKDVPNTYKHYEAIQKVQRAGIIDGAGNGNFNPETTLNRGQMAKILAVGFELEVKSDYDFPDVPESHWANKYVRALYSNGITVGNNGSFEPDEPVTRGQYALFMYRLMNLDQDFEAAPVPKPDAPKPGQPKPEEPTPPVENGDVSGKYPEKADVKKPSGYVEGEWEQAREKESLEIATEFMYGGRSGITLYGERKDNRFVTGYAEEKGMTLKEFSKLIDNVMETGEVIHLKDKGFTIYYDYKYGKIILWG